MNLDQGIVFAVLGITLALFVWNRLRFDVVSMLALLAMAFTGLVPADELFSGFGHPAVITVAAVLVISQGLVNGGVVDAIARLLGRIGHRPTLQVLTLTSVVALCSGFINNVGALALLMPVAIWMSRDAGRSPSMLLMPLAFGSLLGGTVTLIGTPPNIIISSYRPEGAFGLFDFAPVGLAVTVAGIAFITLVGWRLTPRRDDGDGGKKLFSVGDYVTELRVPEGSASAGVTLHSLLTESGESDDLAVLALIRDGARKITPSTFTVMREGDLLLIEANTESLQAFLDNTGLELATGALLAPQRELDNETTNADGLPEDSSDEPSADEEDAKAPISLDEGDLQLMEVVVSPGSTLLGLSANRLGLRERYLLNVVAVARRGQRIQSRLGDIRFQAGDILLVQGTQDGLTETLITLGCLPLAERGLRLGSSRKVALAAAVFGASIAAVVSGLLSAPVALVAGAVAMVLVGLLSAEEAYKSIDWSIIVLLAAMIPVGQALETSGGAQLLANQMLALGGDFSLAAVLAMLLVVTLLLSNVINNAAAAIVVAPVALNLATSLNVPTDAVLMAVAVGASSAFMTPIGHQSNALVMEPGGYQFGDYWRLGLPLSIIVTVVAVPMIMLVWA
ncbi:MULTISPECIES: SLC13 family permease [unclassified Marinobacter]|uniref:SLC13 family permease n=1 Tax=unclassified Marinobacter TaxID=83889 RepID=UPI00200EA443|nr:MULTISPECIES: SLC13 family permease [unclassified Marinobacter]UQG55624.1 SLC13 family permease [Marinobacter sp. M4C]UQG64428.1 SLC13 family permease [Marinobacter sp. M2C]UQG68707.1 SLC13 family permease [Marinobacter sp. M1C]